MTDEIESYREYREYVERTVDILLDELEDYDREIHEAVWETVDSNWIIIYYSNNLTVLEYSDNEPEEWKHYVDDDASWREVIQAMAFRVFEQDIYEELQRRDVDV